YLMTLQGVLCNGRGLALDWMRTDPVLAKALGVDLYAGTLNIKVSGDHFLFEQGIKPEDIRRTGFVQAVPCILGGIDGFIVATWRQTLPREETVFEIVARVKIRDALGLTDQSPVDMSFDPLQVWKLPLR